MAENEQILDVTYGNFSCRLEGFEDSVETMKLVVSFFHDLAGHDRFMDVAPQAPDMATLARLTEDQTGAEVDIVGEGNKVSLRLRKDPAEKDLAADDGSRDAAPDDPYMDDNATFDDAYEDDDLDPMEQAPSEVDASEEIDFDASVSDKLERIRAVTQATQTSDEDTAYAEDLTEPAPVPRATNPLAQRLADLAKRTSQTRILDSSEHYAESSVLADDDEMLADEDEVAQDESDLSDLEFEDAMTDDDLAEDPLAEVAVAEDADPVTDYEEDEDALEPTARVQDDDDDDHDDEDDDEDLAATLDADDFATAPESADLEDEDAEQAEDKASEADDADDAPEAPERPREPDRSTLVLTYRDVASRDNDLSDDDDDDFNLRDEVAKVEAEIAARQGNAVARHGLPRSVDDAMSRIMSQTDQHLNKPESRRHRDAFAQLKAAVAATEAARQLGEQDDDAPDPDEVFKDDLGAHDAEEKIQAQSAAPLKLVQNDPAVESSDEAYDSFDEVEEAIEKANEPDGASTPESPAASPSKPLDAASARLRSIAELKEAEGVAETAGFAEFAASQGAVEIPDLLEAAGAYLCYIEGEEDFSRPQVMKVVQSASKEEISREDGLRYFGRLLRQAKLIKLSNGRFRVSGNTQYRPDDDKAAQG